MLFSRMEALAPPPEVVRTDQEIEGEAGSNPAPRPKAKRQAKTRAKPKTALRSQPASSVASPASPASPSSL